jgi:hypothetical protein
LSGDNFKEGMYDEEPFFSFSRTDLEITNRNDRGGLLNNEKKKCYRENRF